MFITLAGTTYRAQQLLQLYMLHKCTIDLFTYPIPTGYRGYAAAPPTIVSAMWKG